MERIQTRTIWLVERQHTVEWKVMWKVREFLSMVRENNVCHSSCATVVYVLLKKIKIHTFGAC